MIYSYSNEHSPFRQFYSNLTMVEFKLKDSVLKEFQGRSFSIVYPIDMTADFKDF